MPFSLVARIVAVLAIVALIAGVAWKIRHSGLVDGRAEVQAKWNEEKAETARKTILLLEANSRTNSELRKQADATRRDLNAQINSIGRERDDLLERLRNRPERPASGGAAESAVAGSGANPVGCTGAELYRTDGEFLAGEAARADLLRVRLAACERGYRQAQDALSK